MTCTMLLAFLAAARNGLDALPAAAVDTAALDDGLLLCDVPDSTFKPVIRPAGHSCVHQNPRETALMMADSYGW